MSPLDPTEAPPGYVAVPEGETMGCRGCALLDRSDRCLRRDLSPQTHCSVHHGRKDGHNVIFALAEPPKKTPVTDAPQPQSRQLVDPQPLLDVIEAVTRERDEARALAVSAREGLKDVTTERDRFRLELDLARTRADLAEARLKAVTGERDQWKAVARQVIDEHAQTKCLLKSQVGERSAVTEERDQWRSRAEARLKDDGAYEALGDMQVSLAALNAHAYDAAVMVHNLRIAADELAKKVRP